MIAREVMTANPVCCTPGNTLEDAARIMAQYHCGAVPVVSSNITRKLVGIITDRDITCRAAARGKDAHATLVGEFMTAPVASVRLDASVENVVEKMEMYHVRRLPVVNELGQCQGIVAQGDIAMRAPASLTAELIRRISRSTATPSRHVELMGN